MAGQTPGGRPSRSSEGRSSFDKFVEAENLIETCEAFDELCGADEDFTSDKPFHEQLKNKVQFSSWKAGELLKEIDKIANKKVYNKGKACTDTKVLIIGAGPCGLRAAIELALLGAKVVLIEKRSSFTRNNVLYLWRYLITDLTNLGAKKFYGRFGTGDINHISIIKLQTILLKVALLVGVEVHYNVEFVSLDEKPKKEGWRANLKPKDHEISKYEFNVIIAADGRQNTLPDFTWKESSRQLAIGITTNYVNKQSQKDANTKEISGKSYIYDQEFFQGLKDAHNIDLENIVYYKDETHYFVMTAKKQSLIEKGVIKKDCPDVDSLLASSNVNQKSLQKYATEAALYATEGKLPTEEFALNHNGKPDIAMFDFTSRKQATKAVIAREVDGKTLLMAVVGDSLKEPFWPEGTGCALGFLGVFDTVWMIRSVATEDRTLEEALHDREVIYKLLSNTKQEDLNKNYSQYTIDPRTRYTSQVAQNKELYKEEPKRPEFRRNSSFEIEQPRNRTVSEIVQREQVPSGSRRRLKSTAFSMKKSKEGGEEAVKQLEDMKKDGKKGKKKEQKSLKKKEKKPKEAEKEETVKDKKPKDKEQKDKKEKKQKDEKKDKEQNDKTKKKEQKDKKKEKAEEKKKDKSEKSKKEQKNKKPEGNKKTKPDMYRKLKEEDANLSWQEKSRSLNRREFDFGATISKFQNDTSNVESPTRTSAVVEQEEPAKQKKRRRWNPFRWLKKSKKHKDDTDDTDGKNKKEKKSKKKKSKKEKKTKEEKKVDLADNKTKVDDRSEKGDDVSRKSEKDEMDGGHHQGYETMSSSDEKLPKKSKSERGLLKRLKSGKGKHSDYNSLQMEIETQRPIGS